VGTARATPPQNIAEESRKRGLLTFNTGKTCTRASATIPATPNANAITPTGNSSRGDGGRSRRKIHQA